MALSNEDIEKRLIAIEAKLGISATVVLPPPTPIIPVPTGGFVLGKGSLDRMKGVHAKLSEVVLLAIKLTQQDFTVYEGLRTLERQKKLVAQGFSKTLNSMHLPQKDGKGHAYDLVPWIDGHPVWDWTGCYKIAFAMDQAATQLGVAGNIRWGGAWDRTLADFGGDVAAYKKETELYCARHPGKDFIDGPHFEWKD